MILGIISDPSVYRQVSMLNFRGNYDIRHIAARSPSEIRKALEGDTAFTHILMDIDYIHQNADVPLELLSRLINTTNYCWLILANGYMPDSRLMRDLLALGIERENIFLQGGTAMKARISQLLQLGTEEGSFSPPSMEMMEEPQVESSPSILPPSQIDIVAGKAMAIKRPPRPATKAVTVAVAGASPRIGTTTQALQLLLFLRAKDYSCAYLDMCSSGKMEQLLDIYESCDRINGHEFTIQGQHIITNGKLLMQARSEYDYVICDYGPYQDILEPVSFWEKDVKIMVAGTKPWESAQLPAVFEDDDGSLRYIFSFVPSADETSVREQMAESADKTYFAPYAPDYFSYSGADEIYSALVDCPGPSPAQTKEKGLRFLFNRKKKKQ
ncbi:hypothetical protein [Fournierella sp.]|uniref:hypothetical protein n=1 Tax=Allofournierella sp. TaxID=1940256 RepID=UPI00307B02E6